MGYKAGEVNPRLTMRAMAREVMARKVVQGRNLHVGMTAVAVGMANDPKWMLFVDVSQDDGATTARYEFASDDGKLKLFSTVDSLIASVAKVSEDAIGKYVFTLETNALYASKVPANIYTDAATKKAKIVKAGVTQNEKLAAVNALIAGPMAGWESGNAAQVARLDETIIQKGAIEDDIVAINVEAARLQAVVDSKP